MVMDKAHCEYQRLFSIVKPGIGNQIIIDCSQYTQVCTNFYLGSLYKENEIFSVIFKETHYTILFNTKFNF